MRSRRTSSAAYNRDGTLKTSSRKPRTYDEVTRITRERDTRREVDRQFRQGALKVGDALAKVPDFLPWTPTPFAALSAFYKNYAPQGSEYYDPKKTQLERAFGTARGLVDVAVGHGLGKLTNSSFLGFLGGHGSSRLGSAAKGGIKRGTGLARVHNKELVVPKKSVVPLIKLMKKKGVALPISAIRAKTSKPK
jgi:hypothetical protein